MSKATSHDKRERLAAFERLVSEYESPLLRYASRMLRDPNAAQDVVQNAFLRLFRSWPEDWEPSPRLAGWLYRVAHNCAVDYMRREARRRHHQKQHAQDVPNALPPDRGAAFRVSDQAAAAADALHALEARERQLVILKVYEEKSYREIAEITGLTTSNVGYILHHAMKKLAAALQSGAQPEAESSHG